MTQAFNLSQFANKVNTSGQADLTTAVTGTLPVANGGTNQTTYTDGQLLIGNTTGNTLTKATLTAGSGISVTNGSGAITIAATATGGFANMQVFTSPGTFTTPASTTKVKITLVGGGGTGNTAPIPTPTQGGGGGGGGGAIGVYTVTASTPYAVTVGAGGAGFTTPAIPTAGNPGGTSSFGPLVSATGGGGGSGNTGGSGGTSSTGLINFTGQNGCVGSGSVVGGGSSLLGTGQTATRVISATGYGAGTQPNTPGPGTVSSAQGGVVIVEY